MAASPLILTGPDTDTSGYTFRDLTPGGQGGRGGQGGQGGLDPRRQFSAEWDSAQDRYRAAVNAGYSAEDAAQMYLQPVQNKWDILKTVPAELQKSAGAELDQAQDSFLKGIRGGYNAEDAANLYLKPAQQKWVAAASVPEAPAETALDAQLQFTAVDLARQGKNNRGELVTQIPTRFWNNPKFVAALESATQKAQQAATKANAPLTPEQQANLIQKEKQLGGITFGSGQGQIPETWSNAVQQVSRNLRDKLAQPVSFQPPADTNVPADTPPAVAQLPAATRFTLRTPEDQAALAVQAPLPSPLPAKPTGAAPKYLSKFRTQQDVKDAYQAGELSREEAVKLLRNQFGLD